MNSFTNLLLCFGKYQSVHIAETHVENLDAVSNKP